MSTDLVARDPVTYDRVRHWLSRAVMDDPIERFVILPPAGRLRERRIARRAEPKTEDIIRRGVGPRVCAGR